MLINNGHAYHDLMWVYPIALVYDFFDCAIQTDIENLQKLAGVLRVTSYSSRELDKRGSQEIEKMWDRIFNSAQKTQAPAADSKTNNTAADAILSMAGVNKRSGA